MGRLFALMAPAAVLAILSACGASTHEQGTRASEEPPSADRASVSSGSDTPSTTSDGATDTPSRHGYGASALTAFADAITDVALAAARGASAPLPASPIPIERSGGELERLRADPETLALLRAGAPRVLGLYLEVELYLTASTATDAGPEGGSRRADQLSLGLWLGSRGPRVTLLRFVEGGAGAVSLPPPPDAVRVTVERIVETIRSGAAADVVFSEADRDSLDDRLLGAQMLGGAPRQRALAPARRALAGSPRVRAWAFDDVGVLVHASGRTVLLAMKVTVDDTGLVLEAQPLVRAQPVGPAAGAQP